jgi:hypothetical protein
MNGIGAEAMQSKRLRPKGVTVLGVLAVLIGLLELREAPYCLRVLICL